MDELSDKVNMKPSKHQYTYNIAINHQYEYNFPLKHKFILLCS